MWGCTTSSALWGLRGALGALSYLWGQVPDSWVKEGQTIGELSCLWALGSWKRRMSDLGAGHMAQLLGLCPREPTSTPA